MMGTNYFSGTVWAPGRAKAFIALGLPVAMAAALVAMLVASGPAQAVPTTFTVNSTADTGDDTPDGTCNSCTLREAIQEANANNNPTETDTINFAIAGNGPHTITPATELPSITQQVTIDGYSQGDATATTADDATENTIPLAEDGTNAVLKIELNGATASANVNFADGLFITGSAATTTNVVVRGLAIYNFENQAIRFATNQGTGHRVEGNFIGTNAAGTSAFPNNEGVAASSGNNATIGGDEPGDRNLISGNTEDGLDLNTSGNTIEGNIIGLDRNGNPLGNGARGVGIDIPGTGSRILDNSISSNGELGIDLDDNGVTANDGKDPDTGANNLQNFPVISSAVRSSDGSTTITGNLKSTPRKVFTIQFFSSPQADPSGFGEGEDFLGEMNVRTSRKGAVSFRFITIEDVAAGEVVTATATSFATGDTSEFSAARTVTQGS